MIVGRYALGEPLGAGGMAQVVEGHDARLDRRVAVKLLPADRIDPVGRERFRREARSSAGFSHPNAVATFDAGEADGYLYLVMEFVDGPSLADRLARDGALDVDEAVRIADSILAALGAAHAAGIVHRDVKPGNVLLDHRGAVKLADFGIARRLDDLSSDLTGTGLFIGTPKYLAPEQAAGEAATAASDLYATAVVLYEMLAGAAPYGGPTPMATALAHQTAPIPDLRAARPDVPVAVAAAVRRGMAKDPADRFRTAADMRAALADERLPATTVVGTPRRVIEEPDRRVGTPWRPRLWWLALAVGLLGIAAAVVAFGRRDDETGGGSTVPQTSAPAPAATAAPTVAATAPPTAPPATAPPITPSPTVAPAPQTVGELTALLEASPDRYGERADELRQELSRIDGDSPNDARRARRLLDRAAEWVDEGELDGALLPVLETLLGPLVATIDEDGGGNGNDD